MSGALPFARVQVVGGAGQLESRQPGIVAGVLNRLMAGVPVIPANAAEMIGGEEERRGDDAVEMRGGEEERRSDDAVEAEGEEKSCLSYEVISSDNDVDDSADSERRGDKRKDEVECREKKNANFLSSVSDGEEEVVDLPSSSPSPSPPGTLLPSLLVHLRAALSAMLWLCVLWAAANMWSPCASASAAWHMSVADKYAPGGGVVGRGDLLASLLAEHRSTRVL